jgi:hypothetical protein
MAGTITVKPNMSMKDVVLQACGSMEAAVQFCYDNDVAVSAVPAAGTVYVVSDAAVAAAGPKGAAVLKVVAERRITFGSYDVPAQGAAGLLNEDGEVLLNEDGSNLLSD